MTYRELYRYKDLRKDIDTIEQELDVIGYLKGVDYSGVRVSSGSVGDPVASLAAKREKLVDKLNAKKQEAQLQIIIIERFIDSVKDEEVQGFIREHFILLRTYEQIGEAHHYDRTTVSKRIRAYVNISHNSRANCDKV